MTPPPKIVRSWEIGADPKCDLVVSIPTVSGRHCRLTQTADGFMIEDLGSRNGTYVNGERITQLTPIQPSDVVTLGRSVPLPWPEESQRQTIRVIHIGRNPDNDVVLDYPMVSGRHARIVEEMGGLWIEDLDSTNGTAKGSPEGRLRRAPLKSDDILFFGSLRIPAVQLLRGRAVFGAQAGSPMELQVRSTVVGRDSECDEVLDDPRVSRRHAVLTQSADGLTIEDLRSTNGTFVNGRRIDVPTRLVAGDRIAIGRFQFWVGAGGKLVRQDRRGNVSVEASCLTVNVRDRCLLEGVSLTVYPGELVALMGPSGAGKTTLLNALNGYSKPSAGRVFLSGQDLYANYDQFRGLIGYVPQDDIMHGELTVRQALYFSARLRLPADTSDAEIAERISKVISQLGLEGTEDVLIGNPSRRGISGGQRKRVNLAMELLTDPAVLFLDEPTSGLSSEDTVNVLRLLRRLADEGRTIILTIHQPGSEAYRQFDNLILLGKDAKSKEPGRLVYYGPAYPTAIEFFQPAEHGSSTGRERSPDEILHGLATAPCRVWLEKYESSPWKQRYVTERAAGEAAHAKPVANATSSHRPFDVLQWWTLVRRGFLVKWKDTTNTAILAIQAPIIGLLIVAVFGAQASEEATVDNWAACTTAVATTIFLVSIAALWFGCSNAAREIVAEWPIYHRERMVALKLPSYVAAKFSVLGTLCLLQCLVLTAIVAWGAGLCGRVVIMFAFLYLVSLVGLAIGLLVSSIVKTSEAAIAMLPLILLPMVMLAGVLQPLHKMNRIATPLAQAMPSRWAFEGLLLLETKHRPALYGFQEDTGEWGTIDMAERFFPSKTERMGVPASATVLLLTLVLAVFAIHLALRLRDVH